MLFSSPPLPVDPLLESIRAAHRMDEEACVRERLAAVSIDDEVKGRIQSRAEALVSHVREQGPQHALDAFMAEYDLASEEGVVLMCLAEALLRIPDDETADQLIKDKIGSAHWGEHFGQSESFLVNASTWALMLTGKFLDTDEEALDWGDVLKRLVSRASEPVVRTAMMQAMRLMGEHFVLGTTMPEALVASGNARTKGYTFSYDMLGEAALTAQDAARYFDAYQGAIEDLSNQPKTRHLHDAPGISVKLSSLHPRYEVAQTDRVMDELLPKLMQLIGSAKKAGISICVDAEEADRLDLSLQLIERVLSSNLLEHWDGFGLAVQAYQKRALPVVDWLVDRTRTLNRKIMVRLVKGAYWDTEIKRAQEQGLDGYPVFTRKASTDISYLACAQRLLDAADVIYPCFATHNARTIASILEFVGGRTDFEFQCLHGMGREIYDQIVTPTGVTCRIYAPVGAHEQLLPYLMRRLLENGANTSFLNRLADEDLSIEEVVRDPIARLQSFKSIAHPDIPLPQDLFGAARCNSYGYDLRDYGVLGQLDAKVDLKGNAHFLALPLIGGEGIEHEAHSVNDPSGQDGDIGLVSFAKPEDALAGLALAHRAQEDWSNMSAEERAAIFERAADMFEAHFDTLAFLLIREAGKTLGDAQGEIREAVDFLRYYALEGRYLFGTQRALPGPTGETNIYSLHGRGVFLCIAPWNFPLSIFTGQIAAALMAGNGVLAKPAEQTSLVAAEAVQLLHSAGVPMEVLNFLPGDGPTLGGALLGAPDLGGVCFTGSTEVAKILHGQLAARPGPILPLIAETGGQNAMIVDSSALPEQAAKDVLASAFQSAGQRCSALRVLFVQSDISEQLVTMITGAMEELRIGDPGFLSTDVGPVIDKEALQPLQFHHQRMAKEQKLLYQCTLEPECSKGTFFAPAAYKISSIDVLTEEVFGPCLHIIEYEGGHMDKVLDAVNGTGYGLTLSVHSRIESVVRHVCDHARVGNIYVNRNQIGAVVGSQPFGGEGLSGTGPKAGGPNYLRAFAGERTISNNVTAIGGNADLMTLRS